MHRISRRVGIEPGTTMADLANDYTEALEDGFGGPVAVLGISTGGSLALQLAADPKHPVGLPLLPLSRGRSLPSEHPTLP